MPETPIFTSRRSSCSGIKNHQIDNEFHGVFEMVGPGGNPVNANKGRIWKAAYHDGRALLNVSERQRRLASAGAQ